MEKNEPFQIGINVHNKQDSNTYGAVLYLDGIRVKGKKTFSKRSMFLGFKEGGGNYRSFVFNLNEVLL